MRIKLLFSQQVITGMRLLLLGVLMAALFSSGVLATLAAPLDQVGSTIVTVTVSDTNAVPQAGLTVSAFSGITDTGLSGITDAGGQVSFTWQMEATTSRLIRTARCSTAVELSGVDTCTTPGCTSDGITVNSTIVVTVMDTNSVAEAGLTVSAFSGITDTGLSGITDAGGQVSFTLADGSYNFQVDQNGTLFYSGGAGGVRYLHHPRLHQRCNYCKQHCCSNRTGYQQRCASGPDGLRLHWYNQYWPERHHRCRRAGLVHLADGSYNFQVDLNGTLFYSGGASGVDSCTIPGCTTDTITVTLPVVVTVLDANSVPQTGLAVSVFNGLTDTGLSGVTDASGQVSFTLLPGDYNFGVDLTGTLYFSGGASGVNTCTIPGCTVDGITVPVPPPPTASLPLATCSLAGMTRTCDLIARTGSVTMPDGAIVPIWGFTDQVTGTAQLPGPVLIANEGETVVINLTNEITGENVSFSVPGLGGAPDMVGVATGNTQAYTFAASSPGTYIYEAGMTPNGARQTAMGLFGAMIVRPAADPATAYDANSAFNDEALLIFSEIDPAFNADPNNFLFYNFKAKYWLINDQPFSSAAPSIITSEGNTVLLRYINAGHRARFMNLMGPTHTVIGMDGNQVPYAYRQSTDTVAPGQTLDLLVTMPASVPVGTRYPIFEAGFQQVQNGGQLAGDGTVAFGGALTFLEVTGNLASAAQGPLATSVSLSDDIVAANMPVTLSATFDETNTGGDTVVAWEYFTQTVGAPGTGINLAVGAPAVTVNVSETLSAGTLANWAAGDVTFYVRAQDSASNWGPLNSVVMDLVKVGPSIRGMALDPSAANGLSDVMIQATADDTALGQVNVVAAEFFLGTPGADGSGTAMSLNKQAPIASLTGTIPAATVAALPEGPVTVFIHAQDVLGNWGEYGQIILEVDMTGPSISDLTMAPNPNNGFLPINSSIYAVRVRALFADQSTVREAEGFIDSVGANGDGFPFFAADGLFSTNMEQTYTDIPLTTLRILTEGPHPVYFHGLDSAGNWGVFTSSTLIVDRTGPAASNLNVSPNPTAGSATVTISANLADAGLTNSFGSVAGSNIVAAEWFEGFDPGLGIGTPMSAVDAFDSNAEFVQAVVNVSGWTNGSHTISVRGQDAAGNWGPVVSLNLNVTGNVLNHVLVAGFESEESVQLLELHQWVGEQRPGCRDGG